MCVTDFYYTHLNATQLFLVALLMCITHVVYNIESGTTDLDLSERNKFQLNRQLTLYRPLETH